MSDEVRDILRRQEDTNAAFLRLLRRIRDAEFDSLQQPIEALQSRIVRALIEPSQEVDHW